MVPGGSWARQASDLHKRSWVGVGSYSGQKADVLLLVCRVGQGGDTVYPAVWSRSNITTNRPRQTQLESSFLLQKRLSMRGTHQIGPSIEMPALHPSHMQSF
ncbi:hypothetical protein HYQ46_009407 [Verticillium longisporum]|nr:hypothetical protein HYQ46_009407 [Verticillium longisporum]